MKRPRKIESIPIAAISALNPRERSRARLKQIVKSIETVGLKRPITASKRPTSNEYDLACGETRMEALSALGQAEIPAILVDASAADCILMSLVENIARRRHSPVELVSDIGRLAKRYKAPDIAARLGVATDFARAIAYLLKHGEDRLISAVERGVVPPSLAVEIARAKTPELQGALLEGYVKEKHTSKQIAKMRKLVEQRHRKSMNAQFAEEQISAASLVRSYRQETERNQIAARKADLTHARLVFVINALKALLNERMFTSLLREEGLDRAADASYAPDIGLRLMMEDRVRLAFESELMVLPLKSLLPLRQVTERIRRSHKYKVIAASIDEIGVIEPLVVFHKPDQRGRYLLLDGVLKLDILLARGEVEAECLLALDDEAYTYNKMAIRLSIVQEHFMIQRAIERGVAEERIARALNVRIAHIKHRRKMLRGICTQAVHLLSDKPVNPVTFDILRKMREPRQIEACELMVAASSYSSSYARALLAATPNEGRLQPSRRAIPAVVTAADLALMERELKEVQRMAAGVEASFGRDMLDLAIAARYVSELLCRRTIASYLDDNHPEMAKEFKSILSATLAEPSKSAPSREMVGTEQGTRTT